MTPLSIRDVGRMFGVELPDAPGKAYCPFKKHKLRSDKTFRVFVGRELSQLAKCWSCDEPNTWDAVGLYAMFAGTDRKDAWKKLRAEGYAVPGATDEYNGARYGTLGGAAPQHHGEPPVPIEGKRPKKVLPMDWVWYDEVCQKNTGVVERYAAMRGIPVDVLRAHGVVEVHGDAVGFVYNDDHRGEPCRVKVRGLSKKAFWCEPRPPKDDHDSKALAPLYLAHLLRAEGAAGHVVITEGEPDALVLKAAGIHNVVSLPDGASSAKTADLSGIHPAFLIWLVATDDDAEGEKAYQALRSRAERAGARAVRLKFYRAGKTVFDDESFKDANDALLRGNFTPDEFRAAVNLALLESVRTQGNPT